MACHWKNWFVCVLVIVTEPMGSGAATIPLSRSLRPSHPRCREDPFCYDGFILTEWRDHHQRATRFLYWSNSTNGTTMVGDVRERKVDRTALVRMTPSGNTFRSVFNIDTKTGRLGIDDQGRLISQTGVGSSTTFLISQVWCIETKLIRKQHRRCAMAMCAVRRGKDGRKQAFLVSHPFQTEVESFSISDPTVCESLNEFKAAVNGERENTRNIQKLRELIGNCGKRHSYYQFELVYPKEHQSWLSDNLKDR